MTMFDPLLADLAEIRPIRRFGQISETRGATLIARGLSKQSRLGDRIMIECREGHLLGGEILGLGQCGAEILAEGPIDGVAIGDPVEHLGRNHIAPHDGWIGRVIGPEAELLTLATDPAARRQGLARTLMARFEAEARARGAQTLFLEVAENNVPALALYSGCGYARAGRRPAYYRMENAQPVAALLLCKSGV